MKARILATVLVASAVVVPVNTVQAGPLDQASFLAKVIKGKMIDRGRSIKNKVKCKVLPCLGGIKL